MTLTCEQHQAKLDIIDCAYAAATDRRRWPLFIEAVTRTFGGPAMMEVRPAGAHKAEYPVHSFDPDFISQYAAYYAEVNPWVRLDASQPRARVRASDELIGPQDLRRTEFHADFLRPFGLMHAARCSIGGGSRHAIDLLLDRPEARGPFEAAELKMLDEIAPHLQRAMEVAIQLNQTSVAFEAALSGYDDLGVAVILADADRRLVYANNIADTLLRTGDGLRCSGGRIEGRAADARLAAAITAAAGRSRAADHRPGAGFSIERRMADTPLSVTVTPLREAECVVGRAPLAMVLISAPEHSGEVSAEALRVIYELTPAEARLAAALCNGSTLNEHAEAHGVSVNASKFHLKALFDKLGVNRQSDLVAKLARDPLLRRPA